ncbi:MAG: glycosyltransferase family 4 protein [Cyanobacteria bacterium CRU_2_1]|nr:glycosyltransferase family 4 protein [Cyanobacteria bacterium RU_5_0]NJR60482.1 glycosyltransferase family 4 protein [Cyanobacteria bacterium CRU_2_1]
MKIALVHDYLTQRGGAERVFELLCKYFKDADIFTSLYSPKQSINLGKRSVKTTILQNIPGATKHFRLLAPLYFPVFRSLNLQDYDLIISSSTSFAKAVRKSPRAKHICFCHNVTRFLWDTETYLQEYSGFKEIQLLIKGILCPMRQLDKKYAQEPDIYIANSRIVAQRIEKIYRKQATVINYPIFSNKFAFSSQKGNFYLVASRLLGYKRIDITIQAFNALGWPLIIIGDGPERKVLESQALGNIRFLGQVSDEVRKNLMAKARAVVVTALEDYGLVPIEANASGTPVIAYGAGGVLETQISEQTGVFFEPQTPEALQAALLRASEIKWDYAKIRNHALNHFSEELFFKKIDRMIEGLYSTSSENLQKSRITV